MALRRVRESNRPTIEVYLDDSQQGDLHGYRPLFAALAFHVDDAGTIFDGPYIPDVSLAELLCSQPCQ
ncbi:hypothetical protein A5637_20380 [Mycolicibacterium fortuitum]|nr:hypothetical protein A5637_20380 [Mycolicibacterium fortuitum]